MLNMKKLRKIKSCVKFKLANQNNQAKNKVTYFAASQWEVF